MFETILQTINKAYSGEIARRHIAAISQYHRIQASPGYREAARYVHAELGAAGVSAELLTFPANEDARFWTMESFQEWACAKATLDLVLEGQPDQRLCDFSAVPISLIQRSAPADGVYEVVGVENGTREADYRGLDVAGKLVLTDGEVMRVYELAVKRRGAAGVLFDGMSQTAPGRGPLDLPDARQYTSFWWSKGQPKCFGFVLTPRQGRYLRKLLPARVRAHVVSHFYDGAFEVVTALIPGQSDEEVLVASHLCHPQPSANDNASGAAAAIEIAATLRRLIGEGQLPLPRRGIRFLWMPEMTGTYAYLSTFEERLPNIVAGVNLDMVGQDQDRCHSTFNIERPPEAMASFAPVLIKRLWDLMNGEPGSAPPAMLAPPGEGQSGAVRHAVTPFSGGSDHYILSDPTVGVPTPMLIQWPDRFYHTSADTLDKVDPAMLARIGSLAASYAYIVATAGEREAIWLAHEICTRRQRRLARQVQDAITAALAAESVEVIGRLYHDLQRAVAHRIERDEAALASLERLWPGAAGLAEDLGQCIREAAGRELGRAEAVCRHTAGLLGAGSLPAPADVAEPWRKAAGQRIVERNYRGPLSFHAGLLDGLSLAEQDAHWEAFLQAGRDWSTARSLAEYWADGRRSMADIADLVALETGNDFGQLIATYFDLLARKGLVTLREAQ